MTESSGIAGALTQRGVETRQRLLEAARAEIVEKHGQMELAAVTERAGVSPAVPYRYFDSRSGLLAAVVHSFFDVLDDAAYKPIFEEVSVDWWEREKVRIERLVACFYEEPVAPYVLSRVAGDAVVSQARQDRVNLQVRGATANVKAGQKLGRIPADLDAELAGALTIGGVHLAIMSAITRKPRMNRARVIRGLHAFLHDVLRIKQQS